MVSILDVPNRQELARFTQQVRDNNDVLPPVDDIDASARVRDGHDGRSRRARTTTGIGTDRRNPIPMHPGERSPIKHVFYIIKENRTYDQVFGDMPQGNGDPSLVQFGRDVTPNHHALAEQFALLDNYYGPGDQSALGHRWVLQAYPSTWVHKYGNARNNQNPMLLGPTDAIYDSAKAHGLRVRAYGERGANTITPVERHLDGHLQRLEERHHRTSTSPRGRSSSASATSIIRKYPAAESRVPDQYRADIFLKEFAEFEKNGNLPNLVLILLYDDHTEGTSPGFPTPRADGRRQRPGARPDRRSDLAGAGTGRSRRSSSPRTTRRTDSITSTDIARSASRSVRTRGTASSIATSTRSSTCSGPSSRFSACRR